MSLLSVRQLRVTLETDGRRLEIVRGISFEIEAGGFHALVGESGCGKSVTAMALTRLPPADGAACEGEVLFQGRNVLDLDGRERRAVRGRGGISYIFQDPMSALNPVLCVGTQMREALPAGLGRAAARERMLELLAAVDLPDPRLLKAYPCELSGGMAQRVCLAMAMASEPALLVADEPTTALDVVAQKNVLELLEGVCRRAGTSVLLITHNLGLVARHADTVSVMYAGRIVESGRVEAVLGAPAHPYAQGLLEAVPSLDGGGVEDLATIPGRVPPPAEWGRGCTFAPRCPLAQPICAEDDPPEVQVDGSHAVWCLGVAQNSRQGLGDRFKIRSGRCG
ncbi:MAG: ABC transporter ATP-binding protein [Kiritimatiellia bacterium]|jgi:oligopeptide/dipeptide ABC transporter ATP-binding protein